MVDLWRSLNKSEIAIWLPEYVEIVTVFLNAIAYYGEQ